MAQTLPRIQPDRVIAYQFPEADFFYTERETAIYALGVGAAGADPTDPLELPYVYHPDGQQFIKVLPSFAVILPGSTLNIMDKVPGLYYDPKLLLHGEQFLEIYKPVSASGKIRSSRRISGLHDKGTSAILELEILSRDLETGEVLFFNRSTLFLRGAGGFSPSRSQMYSYSSRTPSNNNLVVKFSKQGAVSDDTPDAEFVDHIQLSQALLYRLSGDMNPLHSDPEFALEAGFERPILHGLCTLGFAVRAVIRCCADGDSSKVQSIQCRFVHHVFPGEILVTEMWKDHSNTRVSFVCKVKNRGKIVLFGSVRLHPKLSML
ncbi:hypothetical protein O6H91_12G049400 [Diphasiastrum complanatum]|uniref:Uncharacterized protein n=3 Tax=Diphasiastrum complanatum TaxID=34168 RepID=A0ACC2C1J3_DIPCM|nr:hypothetical protein O6H91_12G049400 [Diphasiastrum complanatum]KAJ7535884.1 hypothetical protein O6H91_12G049400 [Diphasiastrum complanatum]KAJ7535885.1 hypothetical protein O6H91_12G049400 [Diphasiastrum complanatum]